MKASDPTLDVQQLYDDERIPMAKKHHMTKLQYKTYTKKHKKVRSSENEETRGGRAKLMAPRDRQELHRNMKTLQRDSQTYSYDGLDDEYDKYEEYDVDEATG